jgi:hypothetical protein
MEYLAAPQIREIPRRPWIWNISPPHKQGEYLAAQITQIGSISTLKIFKCFIGSIMILGMTWHDCT